MNKGFTLIEMIISVSLGAVMLISISMCLFLSIKTWRSTVDRLVNLESIRSALNIIGRDIRDADEIVPESCAPRLIIYKNPDIIIYDLKDGKVRRTKNNSSQYLTADKSIAILSFAYPAPQLVEIRVIPNCFSEPIIFRSAVRK